MDDGSRFLLSAAVLVGVGAIVPASLGGWRQWSAAAVPAAASIHLAPGWAAALLALPAALLAVVELRRVSAEALWVVVATLSLVSGRLGVRIFDIGEPIITLTAIHFTFAGVGALTLARASAVRPALWLTAGAPPVVAFGFIGRSAAAQIGGALLMTAGVALTGIAEVRDAISGRVPGWRRPCLAVSGLAVVVPMALAMLWAAAQHYDVPSLSIPAMVRWHGVPNAIGFVGLGLIGRR